MIEKIGKELEEWEDELYPTEKTRHLMERINTLVEALKECKTYAEKANCHWCGGGIEVIVDAALAEEVRE